MGPGVGSGEDDLVAELLRRTEANKERNQAIVKQATEANAFTAIDGSVDRRLVTDLDGKNTYLDAREIRKLTQQRNYASTVLRIQDAYGQPLDPALPSVF